MESILIRPESTEQLKTVKAVLKALKVPFEPQSDVFPPHVLNNIKDGIKQYEDGQPISLEEFANRHLPTHELYCKVQSKSRRNL